MYDKFSGINSGYTYGDYWYSVWTGDFKGIKPLLEWKQVTCLKNFGEQAYFMNIPSKFTSKDGSIAWWLYSGNFCDLMNGESMVVDPPWKPLLNGVSENTMVE